MGGIVQRHWQASITFGAKAWMMDVFCSSYEVLLRHLPSVPREPLEFFPTARALKEVNKMWGKEALELVENPRPGYYSRLFLVLKVSGG